MKELIEIGLKNQDLQDIGFDLIEELIDDNLSDGILKEVPIIKTIISIKSTYNTIQDTIFLKKAIHVLMEVDNVTEDERKEFLNKLSEKNTNGSELILMGIERLENFEKCKVFGRLCKLMAKRKIEKDQFLRMKRILELSYLYDFVWLKEFEKYNGKELTNEDWYNLINLGLVISIPLDRAKKSIRMGEFGEEAVSEGTKFEFHLTEEGHLFINYYNELFGQVF